MKKILIILFICPLVCFTQNPSETISKNNLSIGITFAPEYAYRTIKAVDVYGENQIPDSEKEKSKFGFTTGLNLDYSFNNWLTFQTGVMFSNKGYKHMDIRIDESDIGSEQDIKSNFYYLSIPLKAKFYFPDTQPLKFFASVGFSPDFYLSRNTYFDGEKLDNYGDGSVLFNKVNLSFLGNLGFRYNLNSGFFLETSFSYKQALFKLNDTKLKRHLYSLGAEIALYYQL